MDPKAVLFDFDGTLADTLPLAFSAFQTVFKKYDGREVSIEELIAMFGPTEDEILRSHLQHREKIDEAISEYYEEYRRGHFTAMNSPAIIKLLTVLKQGGKKIGVITGKSRRALEISAKYLNLSDFFDCVITGNDVARPKPHPEGILKALDYFGAGKHDAVFLGDSNADIQAGKAAGVRTYAVQWLPTVQHSVFELQPDAILKNTAEFLRLIHLEEC
jgi:phosphoglycolate phosphatase/pyrophosphatase PpaX